MNPTNKSPTKSDYDCVVIGGGPAGSSVATIVAEAGYETLLLEREKMPRFHVGESLMPETYWSFQRLGVLEKMKNSDFVKKYSVQFVSGNGKESQPFFFKEHDERECSQTWQVERSKFDQMLFDNAAEKGAECIDETRVLKAIFDADRATGVRIQTTEGGQRDIQAKVVVDATGVNALIANRLGLCEPIDGLQKAAIWTYYKDAERDPGQNGGATLILHTKHKKSWFWYIPLSNGITSVGLVGDRDFILKGRGSPEQVYSEELGVCPALQKRLSAGARVDDFRVAKEFSFTTKQHAGNGWVLVGDASGFIDPVYSSGVYFALKTGEMAADAIVMGLKNNDTSAETLGNWSECFMYGYQWIRKLVHTYYTNEFSFGRFMKEHPEHRSNLTDILIGRVFYEGAGNIFDDLDPELEKAKAMSCDIRRT